MSVYLKPDGDPYVFNPQGGAGTRQWTWQEDGYTVIRSNARTGPGCHSNCGILLYVKDGVLERVEGDPENPFNRGRLCPRCLAVTEMIYHQDRLQYPLKRTGARGANQWQRITWEGGWGADLLTPEQKNKKLNSLFPYARSMGSTNPQMIRESMLHGKPHQMKACWIQTTNPLSNSAQDPEGALEALLKMEFNVVVDLFMTPTALAAADIVLPAATYAERPGLCGHQPYYLGAIAKAIEPPGECRTDQQIVYELSSRFNEEANPWKNDLELYDSFLAPLGIGYEEIKQRTWAYPPFTYYRHEKGWLRADKKPGFNTASGKYEFPNQHLASLGLDPLPSYSEPPRSPFSTPERAASYPLTLITGARRPGYFLSEHRQLPSLRRLNPDPMVTINTETAAQYDIADGDWVWVENDHGKIKMKAEVTPAIRPDVVNADNGWWFPERNAADGSLFGTFESNCNVLLTLQNGEMGYGSTIKSQLCKIEKCRAGDQI